MGRAGSWGSHLADIVGRDQPAAPEPTQHPHAHLLNDGGEGVRRQCRRGPEADSFGDIGSLFERLEQAREADVRIDQQRTSGPRGAW